MHLELQGPVSGRALCLEPFHPHSDALSGARPFCAPLSHGGILPSAGQSAHEFLAGLLTTHRSLEFP